MITDEEKQALALCEKIEKYCADSDIFYLKLNIELPEGILEEAQFLYDNNFFVPHRTVDGRGWSSCALHGVDWNITTYVESTKDHKWTKLTQYCPIMTDWLKNVFPNDGHYRRCRFMLLEGGGYIDSHTDTHMWQQGTPIRRSIFSAVNISINQPDGFFLRRTDTKEEVPFTPGSVFLFDNGPFHEAANYSKEPRFHFIIHGGDRCLSRAKLYIDSFRKQYPDANI